jgi:hypothetical protein
VEVNGVLIIRICELGIGDKFMYNGMWYLVTNNKLKTLECSHAVSSRSGKKANLHIGAKSKQFVEAVRAIVTPNTELR